MMPEQNGIYEETVGQRIKRRREELGYSQEHLGNLLGYKSRSTVNKIELGVNNITGHKLANMARALNTTVDYLVGNTSYSSNTNEERMTQEAFYYTQNNIDKKKYSVCKQVACLNPKSTTYYIVSTLVNPENEFTDEQLKSIRDYIQFIASKKPL